MMIIGLASAILVIVFFVCLIGIGIKSIRYGW